MTTATRQAQKPWLVIVGVLVGGQARGLWLRRWRLARVWRTVVIAGRAVYIAPLFSFYPTLLIGSIGTPTLAPLVDGLRRREGDGGRRGWRTRRSAGCPISISGSLPH